VNNSIFFFASKLNNENTDRSASRILSNFFLTERTLRESNLNISLVLHVCVHSIDVRNPSCNFNCKHGLRDTIHVPRKHRSRKLYINDLQRAENTASSLRTLPYFPPAFLVSFRIFRPVALFDTLYRALHRRRFIYLP